MSFTKEQILNEHLLRNFYPPYPGKLREAIKTAFQEMWDGKIESENVFNRVNELAKPHRLVLRDEADFTHHFEFFLEE